MKVQVFLLEESFLLVQGERTVSSNISAECRRSCWLLRTAGVSPEQHRLNGFHPTKKETSVLMRTSPACIAVLRFRLMHRNSSWGLSVLLMYL